MDVLEELREAGDVGTRPERLEELSRHGEREVRRAVAGNGNAPWEVLEKLAWEFPREFFGNPVGVMKLLAGPEEVFAGLEDYYAFAYLAEVMMREEDVPEEWVKWFVGHPVLREMDGVQMHVKVAGEQEERNEERKKVVNGKEVRRKEKREQVVDGDVRVRCLWALVCRDRKVLRGLARDEDILVRATVVRNVGLEGEMLGVLAKDEDAGVRMRVAENERTPEEVLRELARDENSGVRNRVAGNPAVSVELLRELAGDEDTWVRRCVAENERVEDEVLERLLGDRYSSVREAVRYAVARKGEKSEEVLRELARDEDWRIRELAATEKGVPEEVLRKLARDEEVLVRYAVAKNESVGEEILGLLLQSEEPDVRRLVALHPRVPVVELMKLEEGDESEEVMRVAGVMRFVREHVQGERVGMLPVDPNVPNDEGVRVYVDRVNGLGVDEEVREALLSLLMVVDGYVLLQQESLPESVLRRFADGGNWRERWLVAVRSDVPEDVRERLRRDGNRAVRAVAWGSTGPGRGREA